MYGRAGKAFEEWQYDPICPAGGNISQLQLRSWKKGAGEKKNHHSIPARLTEMAGSAHSTQSALKQDGDTRTHTHTLCALRGFGGGQWMGLMEEGAPGH